MEVALAAALALCGCWCCRRPLCAFILEIGFAVTFYLAFIVICGAAAGPVCEHWFPVAVFAPLFYSVRIIIWAVGRWRKVKTS